MLRFRYRMRPRKMAVYPGGGQTERLLRLRQIVTGLIRFERVEPVWTQGDEARQYAERLIYLAIKNGDKDRQTMELADFWLLEKDLIHKLFKVLVPRYANYKTCYTDLHRLPIEYHPQMKYPQAVLELRGNPWPPIIARQRDTKFLLSNMLLSAARSDYYSNKRKQSPSASVPDTTTTSPTPPETQGESSQASSPEAPAASVTESEFSSSVDPQPDKQSASKEVS